MYYFLLEKTPLKKDVDVQQSNDEVTDAFSLFKKMTKIYLVYPALELLIVFNYYSPFYIQFY